jgi:hypothetical protein
MEHHSEDSTCPLHACMHDVSPRLTHRPVVLVGQSSTLLHGATKMGVCGGGGGAAASLLYGGTACGVPW